MRWRTGLGGQDGRIVETEREASRGMQGPRLRLEARAGLSRCRPVTGRRQDHRVMMRPKVSSQAAWEPKTPATL